MKKTMQLLMMVLVLLVGGVVSAETTQSRTGATIYVADGAVAVAADGVCSLLEALDNAQNTSTGLAHADCTAGDPAAEDFVELATNGNYLFDATSAETLITGDVSIIGNDATLDHLSAGFFDLASTSHLKMRDLTITGSNGVGVSAIAGNGSLTLRFCTFTENLNIDTGQYGRGAAINLVVSGSKLLDIKNSVFENNVANNSGGAIYLVVSNPDGIVATIADTRFENNGQWIGAPGTTTGTGGAILINGTKDTESFDIVDTHFFDNVAAFGGAIDLSNSAGTIARTGFVGNESTFHAAALNIIRSDVRIEQSLFRHNSAGSLAGGIYNRASALVVQNSTFSENDASSGAAIFNYSNAFDSDDSAVSLDFVTVVKNDNTSTVNSGALRNDVESGAPGASIWIQNSIVFRNLSGTGNNADCSVEDGSITSLGYNMGSDDPTAGCPFTEATDEEATGTLTDHLVDLAENGGPTRTHALTSGSTALNKIPVGTNGCDTSTIDQRGYLRSSGDGNRCDIGAYEFGAAQVPTAIMLNAQGAVSVEQQPILLILLIGLSLGVWWFRPKSTATAKRYKTGQQ